MNDEPDDQSAAAFIKEVLHQTSEEQYGFTVQIDVTKKPVLINKVSEHMRTNFFVYRRALQLLLNKAFDALTSSMTEEELLEKVDVVLALKRLEESITINSEEEAERRESYIASAEQKPRNDFEELLLDTMMHCHVACENALEVGETKEE